MRAIRYLTALLLVLTGILHTVPLFKAINDPIAFPILGFGIVYFTIGVSLIRDKKYSGILGIVFPLIGLGIGFGVVGIKNWDTLFLIMFIIDAVVIISCLILTLNRDKFRNESLHP